ncbi:MAG TPA: NUDIX domain-containing protein [Polyangiaceae bacterium]
MAAPAKLSAGLLMYRASPALEVFLVHPGGPFFAKKDLGAWSIPKGLVEPGEDTRAAAMREFTEEVGLPIASELLELGSITQKGGKRVVAWAFEGDAAQGYLPPSNTFEIEWPPRSGRKRSFPEVDRAEFFTLDVARSKLLEAQLPFLDRLLAKLSP